MVLKLFRDGLNIAFKMVKLSIIEIYLTKPPWSPKKTGHNDPTWITVTLTTCLDCPVPHLLPGLCSTCKHFGVHWPDLLCEVNFSKFLHRKILSDPDLTAKGPQRFTTTAQPSRPQEPLATVFAMESLYWSNWYIGHLDYTFYCNYPTQISNDIDWLAETHTNHFPGA